MKLFVIHIHGPSGTGVITANNANAAHSYLNGLLDEPVGTKLTIEITNNPPAFTTNELLQLLDINSADEESDE